MKICEFSPGCNGKGCKHYVLHECDRTVLCEHASDRCTRKCEMFASPRCQLCFYSLDHKNGVLPLCKEVKDELET